MPDKNINATISVRNDILAVFQSKNAVYAKAEILIAWDSGIPRVKYGDGVTAFNALPFHGDTISIPLANATVNGLFSKEAFTKLAGIASSAQVNVIESIKVNGVALTVSDKGVSFTVPTAISDLEGADDLATAATTLAGYGIEDAYTKTEVDAKVSSLFRLMGEVETEEDLDSVLSPKSGDVYLVEADGSEYVYTANGNWEKFGTVIDLSGYYTKTQIDAGFVPKNGSNRLMTADEGTKLSGITANATKVEQSTVNGNIKINETEATVYELPSTTLDETDSFVINGGNA